MAHFTFAIKKNFFCYFFLYVVKRTRPMHYFHSIDIHQWRNFSPFITSYYFFYVFSFSLVAWTSFNIITSQNLKKRFYLAKIKRKTPLNSSSNISHFGLCYKVKFETKARILAMRLAMRGCWRPCYSRKFFCYFCFRY